MDEEDEAMRALDQQDGEGPEVPPLCPQHRQGDVFWTSDDQVCPLCERKGRSGSWVICAACGEEAGVCVYDGAPRDGSSAEPVPWLAEVVALARRDRDEAQFGKPRGTGRYSKRDKR